MMIHAQRKVGRVLRPRKGGDERKKKKMFSSCQSDGLIHVQPRV
jgi:hypothetical protein